MILNIVTNTDPVCVGEALVFQECGGKVSSSAHLIQHVTKTVNRLRLVGLGEGGRGAGERGGGGEGGEGRGERGGGRGGGGGERGSLLRNYCLLQSALHLEIGL